MSNIQFLKICSFILGYSLLDIGYSVPPFLVIFVLNPHARGGHLRSMKIPPAPLFLRGSQSPPLQRGILGGFPVSRNNQQTFYSHTIKGVLMELQAFPKKIQPHLLPKIGGRLEYNCLQCGKKQPSTACCTPGVSCGGVLLIENRDDRALASRSGAHWQHGIRFPAHVYRTGAPRNFLFP